VTFLMKRLNRYTEEFWTELERGHQGAPSAIQELARGDISVVCTLPEANAALQWARNQPLWSDDTPALAIENT
jgi:hypothetical protein